jgi:Fe-S-cluster containining protein
MNKVTYRTPGELKEKTRQNKKALLRLISQLKRNKSLDLDTLVHELHREAFQSFDCTTCANCCRTIGPRLIPGDITRLAKKLKMRVQDFYSQYIAADEDSDIIFAGSACPFILPDNLCSVYEYRPRACRDYPHTDRKRFHQILDLTFKNCETCPVVFDIMNELNSHF